MKHKLVSPILILSITVILVLSFNAFDLQSKFSVFAQTPDDSNLGPIPEGNYTDPNTGPIPEDNSTDPSMIPNPMDNSTDMQNLNPAAGDTIQEDNMTRAPEDLANPLNYSSPQENASVSSGPPIPTNVTNVLPPLEQVKSGVQAKDVQCKQGFTLIIKAEDDSPACVYPQVAQILAQRGW
jgi:hypothetical protein